MTEYEVKCLDTWAWYPAYVHDYDENKQELYIAYPDDWKEATWVSPEHVRPPPDQINLDEWHPQIDEEVECQAKAEENEQHGWWSCKIKSYQNNKFCVSFDGWGSEHNVILQKELLRPKNRNKCLTSRNLQKAEVSVKPDLVPWAKNNPTQLAELRLLHKKLIHMNFNHQSNQIILIAPKSVLTSVKSIVELHLLRQESLIKQKKKTLKAEELMHKRKKMEESACRQSFPVHPLLSGYCCGVKRTNFERVARESQGQIIKISIENGQCVIKGRTQEAIDKAVMELKIVSKKIILTKKEVAFLIGVNGGNIRKLKSHVQLLKLVSKKFAKDDFEQLKEKAIKSELKRIDQRERRTNRQNTPNNYSYDNIDTIHDLRQKYRSKLPHNLLTCSLDTFFHKDDIIDLCDKGTPTNDPPNQPKDPKDDFIVLIGKENEVNLCISMIELSLTYLRKQKERENSIRITQNKIRALKGLPLIKTPYERERERQIQRQQENNHYRQTNNNNNNNNNNNDNFDENTDDKETKDREYSTDMPNDDMDMKDENNNNGNNNRRQGRNKNKNNNNNNNTNNPNVNNNPNGNQTGSSKKSKKNKRKRRKKTKRSNVPDTVVDTN